MDKKSKRFLSFFKVDVAVFEKGDIVNDLISKSAQTIALGNLARSLKQNFREFKVDPTKVLMCRLLNYLFLTL
jgi:hypothetical protein